MNASRWATAPDPQEKPAQNTTTVAPAALSAPTNTENAPGHPTAALNPQASAFEASAPYNHADVPQADAPTYYDYPNNEPASLDEFAQTRPPDDLFDDDFTPVTEPVIEITAAPQPKEPTPQPQPSSAPSGPRGGRGATRGRGNNNRQRGGRGGNSSLDASRHATEPAETATKPEAPEGAPTGPAAGVPERGSAAVRGDRTLTGGPRRSKLSENELSEKLEAMRLKNANLQAAHERAEADLAIYQKREAEAAAKRKVERQNRQQMMGEREKNRQRKLNALGGREWDAEKEDGFGGTGEERRRGARRGAYGGVVQDAAPEPVRDPGIQSWLDGTTEDAPGDVDVPIRGAGDRSRGRGRGRGKGRGDLTRGGRQNGEQVSSRHRPQGQSPPAASDFPELPSAAPPPKGEIKSPPKVETSIKPKEQKAQEARPAAVQKQESFLLSPLTPGADGQKKSWADQME